MKTLQKNLRWADRRRKGLFRLLLCLIFSSALLYGYLVNSAVVAVVRRGVAEKERDVSAISVAELEAKYLEGKRGVTASVAREYGFQDARVARFISKKTVTALRSGTEL